MRHTEILSDIIRRETILWDLMRIHEIITLATSVNWAEVDELSADFWNYYDACCAIMLLLFCIQVVSIKKCMKWGLYERGLSPLTHPYYLGYKSAVGYIHLCMLNMDKCNFYVTPRLNLRASGWLWPMWQYVCNTHTQTVHTSIYATKCHV